MKAFAAIWRSAILLAVLCSAIPAAHSGAMINAPPLLLPRQSVEGVRCDKASASVVRALLFGVTDYPALPRSGSLLGPQNDAALLGTALNNLGVNEVDILSGKVELASFVEKLQSTARRSHCGDSLILSLSGQATAHDYGLPFLLFSDATQYAHESHPMPKAPGERVRRRVQAPGTLDSAEMLVYFDWLRGRGINVFFILDTMFGQRMAGQIPLGHGDDATLWRPFEQGTDATRGADGGAYFGIYEESSFELVPRRGESVPKMFGALTYSLATALLTSPQTAGFRALATSTAQSMKQEGVGEKSGLTFESSHPNRSPLAVGLPGNRGGEVPLRGREDRRIDITNPAALRGAARVSGHTLLIEGRVVAPTPPTSVEANNTAGRVNADGSFSVRLPIHRGENKVALVAWWGDSDFLPRPFMVVSNEGDQVVQEGKRYALIIANQSYKDPVYGKLETPIADALALAERLERKFDFKTTAQIGGQAFPLVLKNATKVEMERALSRLRKVLTPADSLMVFYAGHGIYSKELDQAYWLPVDAEADEPSTWLSAYAVQSAIQLLEARHVLVVADSCFSGGFRKRGTEPEDNSPRLQRLTNSMSRASREFISSGDNEPVSDGGGRGHSMFARALLDALDGENKPFTAGELFQNHVKSAVGGKSGQSPQYFPFPTKEGHDGGEFVFLPVMVDGGTRLPLTGAR